ncbi:MAG: hypothetical protein P4L46_24615 [Fimbriimonas sp.]|nr:hypothetical protein [Fimbriimonas sp.]
MPRAVRSKQLPYLTEYVRYAADWEPSPWHENVSGKSIGIGLGVSLGIGGLVQFCLAVLGLAAQWGFSLAACSVAFAVFFVGMVVSGTRRAKDRDPLFEMRREATQVAGRLEACVARKRLHRDLSSDVAALLEQAATNWQRARTTLDSPYWRSADLPNHLRTVREQSLLSIDQGMQELLVLCATSVPTEPGNWSFGEVIDEAFGQDVFNSRNRVQAVAPLFDQSVGVAQKLQELADQVESLTRQLASQELIAGAPKPGSSLEATLQELRRLKDAEDELRQDLRT